MSNRTWLKNYCYTQCVPFEYEFYNHYALQYLYVSLFNKDYHCHIDEFNQLLESIPTNLVIHAFAQDCAEDEDYDTLAITADPDFQIPKTKAQLLEMIEIHHIRSEIELMKKAVSEIKLSTDVDNSPDTLNKVQVIDLEQHSGPVERVQNFNKLVTDYNLVKDESDYQKNEDCVGVLRNKAFEIYPISDDKMAAFFVNKCKEKNYSVNRIIYAPPHSGKSTWRAIAVKKGHHIYDTDDIRLWGNTFFHDQIEDRIILTNMQMYLKIPAKFKTALIPSHNVFKERCLLRHLDFHPSWKIFPLSENITDVEVIHSNMYLDVILDPDGLVISDEPT